jgi:WS/DGAT/MGAT family acyltransferase
MTIDRLSSLDQIMVWASRKWPQDVGALALLDASDLFDEQGRFRIEDVREALRRRILLVRRFRQVLLTPRRGLGAPVWVDAPAFDIADHVRERRLEPPAGEAELLLAIEQIRQTRLDATRPLWEMWFLTGLTGRGVGWFVRIHHVVADGTAAMATLATLLDPIPDAVAPEPPPLVPAPLPSSGRLLADNVARRLSRLGGAVSALLRPRSSLRAIRAALPAFREILAERPATETSLDRVVGSGRTMALVRTDLASVKAIGRAHDATVNDVLLAVTGAGLRAVLLHRGEPVSGTTIRAYVPVSLRRGASGIQEGNLIAQMAVPLDMGEADPARRLDGVALETTQRKERARTSLAVLLGVGNIGRRLLLMAVMRQRVNVATACIAGPTVPLYLAGARVLEVFPVVPLIADEPLGAAALSYAGSLAVGIVADTDAYPDLEVFASGVRGELDVLARDALGAEQLVPA